MAAPPSPELSAVRQRLTKMTDRILMRLHDRAGFPLNRAVYSAGAIPIPGRADVSLLDFAIEGLEAYHASLGRFEFPDQFALSSAGRPRTPTADERVQIELREKLERFYVEELLPKLCTDADDRNCYGETAYVDADLLALLHERLHVGRDVARAKVEREPDLWALVKDESEIRERLTDRPREEAVIADAIAAAQRYSLDAELVRFLFRWVIDCTLELEVEYLKRLSAATA